MTISIMASADGAVNTYKAYDHQSMVKNGKNR